MQQYIADSFEMYAEGCITETTLLRRVAHSVWSFPHDGQFNLHLLHWAYFKLTGEVLS
jgi:hypothetical protein